MFPLLRVEQLIDEFSELGGEELTFSGGEPFLFRDLPKLIQLASKKRLSTVVFSSGVLYEKNKLTALSDDTLGNFTILPNKVVFSLYDSTPSGHELITRQPGSYQLTVESIKKCNELGIRVDLHFVPTKLNIDSFPELVRIAEQHQCQTIRILRYVPHGRGKRNRDQLQPDYVDMKRFIDVLRDLKHKSRVELKLGSAFGFIAPDLASNCTAGIEELVVDAHGSIFPCSAFSNFSISGKYENILQSSLSEVWNNSEYLKQVRNALIQRPQYIVDTKKHLGCIAQKTIYQGYITDDIDDPDQVYLLR
jgi:MoaA/NifB/PqqE/SkfB family radical SAM enzyme